MNDTGINLAFYISGKASRLSKIINDNRSDLLKDVKVVFSDDTNNEYIKEELQNLNIKYFLLNFKDIESEKGQKNSVLSNALLSVLEENKIDYCFSFGAHILKGNLLKVYENRIINFHPSILPSYPGLMSIDQAIEGKENLLGNTAHFVDSGTDTGPIIMQSVIPTVAYYENGYDVVLDIQIDMLYKIYYLLKEKRISVVDNQVIIEGADYHFYSIFPYVR
jgi:phosphoribosylglycinamide formyltransferase-1